MSETALLFSYWLITLAGLLLLLWLLAGGIEIVWDWWRERRP